MPPKLPMRLEYISLDELEKWPVNPKKHTIDELEQSMEHFGFTQPILIDEKTGKLVAGHGRLDVLRRLRERDEPAPDRILVKQGRWHVPVIRGIEFGSEEDAMAYLLADNRLTENGGWDAHLLNDLYESLPDNLLEFTGFQQSEIDKLLVQANRQAELQTPKPEETEIVQFEAAKKETFDLLVSCDSEHSQMELLKELSDRGIKTKLLVS